MDRREFVSAAALVGLVAASKAAGAEPAAAPTSPHQLPSSATSAAEGLAAAARACTSAAEACVRHCSTELAAGNKSMADCNYASHATIAVSGAMASLATLRSARVADLFGATVATASACAKACREHEKHFAMGMHLECKACAEACEALVAAVQKADAAI